MKPSGAFGIGFQSAFLLSDCIRINTKSIFSNETLELEMHSPLGPNEGLVLVRRVNNDVAQSYGTKIEISFNLDRFAKRWKVSGLGGKRRLSLAAQLVTSMDPLFDDSFPYDAAEIVDEIMGFGENSLVGVKCNFSPAAKENVLLSSSPEPDDQWRFLPDAQDNYVGIRYWSASDRLAGRNSRYLYRGQPFKCESIYLPHVAFEINLLSGGAGVWLSANRDQLTPRAGGELRAVVLSALTQAVELDIKARTTGRVDGSHFPADFSLFVNAMALSEGGAWEGFAAQCSDAWKDVALIRSSIRSCFDRPLWTFGPRADVDSRQIEHCDVCSASDNGDTLVNLAMRAWAKEKGGSVQVMSMDDFRQTDRESEELSGERIDVEHDRMVRRVGGPVFRFSLDPQPRYSEAAFSDHLIKVTSSFHNCRYLVPIEDERWRMLALREGFKINARWLIQNYENASSIMLLPYLFCDGQAQSSAAQLDKLCLIMQPVLANKLSVGEIRETYEALISYIDGDLMAKSHHAQDWMVARSA